MVFGDLNAERSFCMHLIQPIGVGPMRFNFSSSPPRGQVHVLEDETLLLTLKSDLLFCGLKSFTTIPSHWNMLKF